VLPVAMSHLVVSGITPNPRDRTNAEDQPQATEKAMDDRWKRIALAIAMCGVSMLMVVLVRAGL